MLTPKAPRLVLQGTNDSFGRPEEIRAAIGDNPGISLVELPGADHGYRTAKAAPFTPADLRATLVAEVDYTEWTRDGRMRHPSFKGLRDDYDPANVVRE